MPPPLDPAKRQAIADAIRAGGTRNGIAREHGVSGHVVTTIAEQEDLDTSAWDRTQTKRATAARQVDIAARSAELAALLLEDAFNLRERAWERQQVLVQYKDSSELVDVDTPAGDFRNYYTSIGIIVDKVAALTRDDSEQLAAVDSWLRSVVGG